VEFRGSELNELLAELPLSSSIRLASLTAELQRILIGSSDGPSCCQCRRAHGRTAEPNL